MTESTLQKAPATKVLEGIERIHWTTTSCLCFVGSVLASMHYLGEPVENPYLMGISGGAFKFLWFPGWSPALCDLLIVGEEPIERTFAGLGYEYTFSKGYDRPDAEQVRATYRRQIVESIDRGVPVIAQGIVGPPEACVVAGCEQGGEVLRGWSYFQEDADHYFRAEDWEKDCYALILIGDKVARPSPPQVLRDSLEWAIELCRVPTRECLPVGPEYQGLHYSGLAAYDAVVEALGDDEAFPEGDLAVLTFRSIPIGNDGIHLLACKRGAAASFLNGMADQGLPGADELRQAAAAFEGEAQLLRGAWGVVPFSECPPEDRLKLADPAFRREIAQLVRAAKAHAERAVEHLEGALAALR